MLSEGIEPSLSRLRVACIFLLCYESLVDAVGVEPTNRRRGLQPRAPSRYVPYIRVREDGGFEHTLSVTIR